MAHLAAQLKDGECGCAQGVLKQRAFGLGEAIHAHFDALREMLEHGGKWPRARGFHAGGGFYLIEPD